jgi:hypothetical protein
MHPAVVRREIMPVKNRILFIIGWYRFQEDITRWMGTSLWGVTLPNIDGVSIWRQDCARPRQPTLSPCFPQARIQEKSREFEENGNEVYANQRECGAGRVEGNSDGSRAKTGTCHRSPNI